MSEMINTEHHKSVAGHVATEDIKFGYCTEIMVALKQVQYVKDFNYDMNSRNLFEQPWGLIPYWW